MTCGIDEILQTAAPTLERIQQELVTELLTDFDQEGEYATLAGTPQLRELQGALQTFAVWLIHGRTQD